MYSKKSGGNGGGLRMEVAERGPELPVPRVHGV